MFLLLMLDFYVLPMESMESLHIKAESGEAWIDAEMAIAELYDPRTILSCA